MYFDFFELIKNITQDLAEADALNERENTKRNWL